MSRSKTYSLKQTSSTHHVLIGVPLVLVVVFCFSFVLLQPAKTNPNEASANQTTAPEATQPVTDSSASSLDTIPLAAQTTLPTLEPAAAASDAGTTPQASSKSGAIKSANPQGVAAGQQISPNTVIRVSSNNLFKNLTNLTR